MPLQFNFGDYLNLAISIATVVQQKTGNKETTIKIVTAALTVAAQTLMAASSPDEQVIGKAIEANLNLLEHFGLLPSQSAA